MTTFEQIQLIRELHTEGYLTKRASKQVIGTLVIQLLKDYSMPLENHWVATPLPVPANDLQKAITQLKGE